MNIALAHSILFLATQPANVLDVRQTVARPYKPTRSELHGLAEILAGMRPKSCLVNSAFSADIAAYVATVSEAEKRLRKAQIEAESDAYGISLLAEGNPNNLPRQKPTCRNINAVLNAEYGTGDIANHTGEGDAELERLARAGELPEFDRSEYYDVITAGLGTSGECERERAVRSRRS